MQIMIGIVIGILLVAIGIIGLTLFLIRSGKALDAASPEHNNFK
jgi:hypothetical protein